MKPHMQTALKQLHKTWSRSELSLLVADLSHFHDEIEDDLSGEERAEFLDMKASLSRLLAIVEGLLPEDGATLSRHDKRTVLLTKDESSTEDDG